MATLLIDANVFLYAIGGESEHREDCRRLLLAIAEGRIDAVTNSEVLQEILHVRRRRLTAHDAVESVREAAAIVRDVLPIRKEDVLLACGLMEMHPDLGARDAIHVASMKNANLTLLASVDKDFDRLQDVKRLTPAEAIRPGS